MDFLAQTDHTNLIIKFVGVALTLNGIGLTIMLGLRRSDKKELEDHKKEVRYSETCNKVHEGLTKLVDERHKETKETLARIEDLIRKNGNGKPRVQT